MKSRIRTALVHFLAIMALLIGLFLPTSDDVNLWLVPLFVIAMISLWLLRSDIKSGVKSSAQESLGRGFRVALWVFVLPAFGLVIFWISVSLLVGLNPIETILEAIRETLSQGGLLKMLVKSIESLLKFCLMAFPVANSARYYQRWRFKGRKVKGHCYHRLVEEQPSEVRGNEEEPLVTVSRK